MIGALGWGLVASARDADQGAQTIVELDRIVQRIVQRILGIGESVAVSGNTTSNPSFIFPSKRKRRNAG